MKVFQRTCYLLLVVSLFIACDKESSNEEVKCDYQVIVNDVMYDTAASDFINIDNVEVLGDCLEITFSASGCSGDSWEVMLLAHEKVLYSNPAQRSIRLSLKNEEMCEAYITKTTSFNIEALQSGGNEVFLNLDNYEERISYTY